MKLIPPAFHSTKFQLTVAMLAGVFLLKWRGIDVEDLSLVLPLILGFYTATNVAQDFVNKKYGNRNGRVEREREGRD